jgi:NADP-dependent 3-hydroxy acid dehydrogenase YdfG
VSEDQTQASGSLAGRTVAVTGASSGIGRSLAIAMAREGAVLCALGRDAEALEETVSIARQHSQALGFQGDITVEEEVQPFLQYLQKAGRLDILIHSAGLIRQDLMASANVKDLDLQYRTNVRAPYWLTQQVLPLLIAARGQVVFVNSSAGLTAARSEVGQYAATKHALKAIADSLREEVNSKGVRVLSVFLGRTATPMQKAIFRNEGKSYSPEKLLQPEDIASIVLHAMLLPPTAEVTDIMIRPMFKP